MINYVHSESIPQDGIVLVPVKYAGSKTKFPKIYKDKFSDIASSIYHFQGPYGPPGLVTRMELPTGQRLYAAFIECLDQTNGYDRDDLINGIKYFGDLFNHQHIHPNFHLLVEALDEMNTHLEYIEEELTVLDETITVTFIL